MKLGLIVLACVLTGVVTGCGERARDAPEAAATAPPADASVAPPPEKGPRHDEIMGAIKALTDRHACNRVTGCPGAVSLFQYGPELIAPAAEALARPDRGDNHWTIVLPELIGQTGDALAAPPLITLLNDKRWEIRIAAAVGLAHLGDKAGPAALAELKRLAALPDNEPLAGGDFAMRLALELALMRIDTAATKAHRETLRALMPLTPEAVAATPAPLLDVALQVIGHARLSEALATVRGALGTGNRFVVATALEVAGKLQDNGAIGPTLTLLEDANPTIKRSAFRTLTRITGATFDTAEQWREWAKRYGIAPK